MRVVNVPANFVVVHDNTCKTCRVPDRPHPGSTENEHMFNDRVLSRIDSGPHIPPPQAYRLEQEYRIRGSRIKGFLLAVSV